MFTKILAAELYDDSLASVFPKQFDVVPGDSEQIARICNRLNENQIILLKRPEGIRDTAKMVAGKVSDKTILIISVENTLEQSSIEDLLNLGAAIAFVQTLPAGVYIVHKSQCYLWNELPMSAKQMAA